MNSDSVEDIGNASALLQALVKDLRSNQSSADRVSVLANRITNLVKGMHQLTFERAENNAALIQIHSSAVTLWNIAVAMKTGSGQAGKTENAKLRHAACKLSILANAAETSEVTYRKQLVMTAKTGRAWLDCENLAMADECLALASECWNGLQKLWSSRDEHILSTSEQSKQIAECERYMFRVFCYRAETSFSMSQQDKAQLYVTKAKEFLGRLPTKECNTLAELCYNFGVDTYYREEYEKCIAWLRESYDLRKENSSSGANKQQATTLRLMANAYLDWDSKQHWQMALNAVDLANSEHGHPAGLYLKAKLLLMGNGDEEFPCSRLRSVFEETLLHPDLKVDLGLCAVNLAVQYKRAQLAFDCLEILESRFKNSLDLYKVDLEHLELLLKNDKDEDAKALIEKCIVEQMERSLDSQICQRFHILLWEKAASAYEKDYREALDWYNYSLSFFSSREENVKNIGKLLRNKCSCYMNLQDYEKAKEAIVEAEQSDPDSPVIQFYKFKIALAEGQDTIAVDAMTKMSEIGSNYDKIVSETDAHGLLCLAAQQALEQKNHNVAVSALEKVVASSADNQQVLTSLRCLTRLKLTHSTDSGAKEDHSSFLRYLQTALDHLNQMELVRDSNVLTEAAWFMKIAWNLALESTDCCADMQELFVFCYKFSCLCPMESSNLVRQKNCLVMAAASAVQAAREQSDGDEKTKLLKQCLEYVDASRVLRKKIGIGGLGSSLKDESLLLLALYEFEAKAQLGDSDLCFCLDAAEALPNADPGTFETFAALAVEPPCHHREISMRALRIAIKKHLAMDVIDFTKLSKAFHSLVHHSLSSGRSSDAESKEEAFTVCQDICEIIENKAKGCYPEIQILWLMTKAWNCGINLFSAGGHEAGEKWCGLAMRLLHHLSTFKCNYQDKMTKVYGDILDRMERNTFKGQVEE
ncbi:testis-expressed protein 11-like isoform X2 [Stylophora pistillata]|uniref:testis-expressed protein 11-like isoform X2 n=1 Tax=Stylophora pistillata TaxID=50429 RepID=UPI000C04939D|nr:testis-expressed protein 11-like isoform X2 [Stylophora pistillata]